MFPSSLLRKKLSSSHVLNYFPFNKFSAESWYRLLACSYHICFLLDFGGITCDEWLKYSFGEMFEQMLYGRRWITWHLLSFSFHFKRCQVTEFLLFLKVRMNIWCSKRQTRIRYLGAQSITVQIRMFMLIILKTLAQQSIWLTGSAKILNFWCSCTNGIKRVLVSGI